MLLEKPEIDINQESDIFENVTALNYAAFNGKIEATKLLLANKDINVDKLGYYFDGLDISANTALQDAVDEEQIKII